MRRQGTQIETSSGTDPGAGGRGGRHLGVEVLRIVAILGIAVFHTFQPWFGSLVGLDTGVDASVLAGAASTPPAALLATMGCIDQLGAWGNHVFIMVSGYFLLPKAVLASAGDGYWAGQAKATIRRAFRLLLAIAFWAVVALACSFVAPDVTTADAHGVSWLLGGIQFIWVYVFLVVVCPVVAWVWARLRRPGAVLAVVAVLVLGLGVYVAFFSQGSDTRSLFEWRKLLSAAAYAVSFFTGGWLAGKVRPGEAKGGAAALAVVIVATIAAEVAAATLGGPGLVNALSFKSTSVLAYAGAVAALVFALGAPVRPAKDLSHAGRLTLRAAGSILGFYVLQSFFSLGWHELANDLLARCAQSGFAAFLLAGIAFSAALLVILTAIDALVRAPLTSRVGSSRERV